MKRSQKVKSLLEPFDKFFQSESSAGILLFVCAVTAVIWANSPWRESYHHLWDYHFSVGFNGNYIDKTLHHWINDGLMAIFFFTVGLELKREIIAGELSEFKKALLPFMAAAGGMIIPALAYSAYNYNTAGSSGWGIPMATDIAFALGVLALLGKRVPLSLKIFLTALAITDDLGAVLVIAFFYTSDISFINLTTGIIFMAVLLLGNAMGVRKSLFYGVVGIAGVWLAFLMSGVHATIAGVLAAMAIPARTKIDEVNFVKRLEVYMDRFKAIPPNDVTLLEPSQYEAIDKINKLTDEAATPLQQLEHTLHPWVAYFVMPIFALANAGIELSADIFNATFFQGVSMGVFAGLVFGKFVGVVGVTFLLKKIGIGELPVGASWTHICGIGLLAGIGFTMSLFITNLAFTNVNLVNEAKAGIFTASIVTGLLGYFVLRKAKGSS